MSNQSKLTISKYTGWGFAFPGFSMIFLFIILPFILAIWFSLTNQRLISPNPTEFVGLENYKRLLSISLLKVEPKRNLQGHVMHGKDGEILYPRMRNFTRNANYPHLKGKREWFSLQIGENKLVVLVRDVVFMKAFSNIIIFTLCIVPLQGGIALLLALLINQHLWGINIFRSIYFMPVVISIVVISLLWRFIYDGSDGLLNSILYALSFGLFEPIDWLGRTDTALGSIIVMSAWQGVGFHMVIWLAGLQNIPQTHYEVAAIEGANKWQTFRYVTWPGLRNTAILVLIVITMQAFALFAQIDVMTKGGPLDSTQSLVFQAVERGYGKQDISGGSTISVVLFIIVLMISMLQKYLTREKK
jgi:multiple sugar transport system permease protein